MNAYESIDTREEYLDPDYGAEKPICYCDICGGELYAGDYVTDINGEKWCDQCLKDNRHCLEEDDFPPDFDEEPQ